MILADDGRPLTLKWSYSRAELVADGVVHVLGVGLGAVGAAALVGAVLFEGVGAGLGLAVMVYAVGLVAMLGVSAAYNMWPIGRLKWWLRRVDHSTIYLMIAATYTPFVAVIGASRLAWGLLAAMWAMALAGAALKLLLPGRFDRLSIALYIAMGWSGLLAYEPVLAGLPSGALWLLAAGGLLYTVGVVFHVMERLPFQNAIWHGFVLAAAACHYGAVCGSVLVA
jgi:hemolysin III